MADWIRLRLCLTLRRDKENEKSICTCIGGVFVGVRLWTEEDWDLVKPLEQTTTGDMGYGKIDYNNDGITEYFYRIVERKCLTATGYEVSDDRHEIIGNYDL